MSAAAHIEEIDDPVVLQAIAGKAGFYVSFDETPDYLNGDWEGPFETLEAASDYATSIIETAAADAVRRMFK